MPSWLLLPAYPLSSFCKILTCQVVIWFTYLEVTSSETKSVGLNGNLHRCNSLIKLTIREGISEMLMGWVALISPLPFMRDAGKASREQVPWAICSWLQTSSGHYCFDPWRCELDYADTMETGMLKVAHHGSTEMFFYSNTFFTQ